MKTTEKIKENNNARRVCDVCGNTRWEQHKAGCSKSSDNPILTNLAREAAEQLYHAGPKDADIELNTEIILSALIKATEELKIDRDLWMSRAVEIESRTAPASAEQQDWQPYTLPFRYDSIGCQICDFGGKLILDIRGWGFLTGLGQGGLKMDEDEAAAVQDRIGNNLIQLINGQPQKERTGHEPS